MYGMRQASAKFLSVTARRYRRASHPVEPGSGSTRRRKDYPGSQVDATVGEPAGACRIRAGQDRARNPMEQIPCLELDSSAMVAEIAAIARVNLENLDNWIERQKFITLRLSPRPPRRHARPAALALVSVTSRCFARIFLRQPTRREIVGIGRRNLKASIHVMEAGGHVRPRPCTPEPWATP